MIVARLSISYDRGTTRNSASDIGASVTVGERAADGRGIVRGLGSRWRDEQAKLYTKSAAAAEARIRKTFGRQFLASPLPGLLVVPDRESPERVLRDALQAERERAAKTRTDAESGEERIAALSGAELFSRGFTARVALYDMTPTNALPPAEIREWQERISKQLATVPLGSGKTASDDGLATLTQLASCPVLSDETRSALNVLIGKARLETVDRLELRRQIEAFEIDLTGCEAEPARELPEEPAEPLQLPAEPEPARELEAEPEPAVEPFAELGGDPSAPPAPPAPSLIPSSVATLEDVEPEPTPTPAASDAALSAIAALED